MGCEYRRVEYGGDGMYIRNPLFDDVEWADKDDPIGFRANYWGLPLRPPVWDQVWKGR